MESAHRAQSSVIGVVLLTGVVILSITTIGVFWIGSISDQADASGPLVETEVTVTDADVTVSHRMGETLNLADVRVILRNGSASEEFLLDTGTIADGDTDGKFEPSEDVVYAHGLGSGTFDVLVVHDPSNTVVHRNSMDVEPGSSGGVYAGFGYEPGSPETGETVTFDASESSGVGGVERYHWDWTDDGIVDETTSSPTVDHTFGSAGSYSVNLTVTDANGSNDTATETIEVTDPAPTTSASFTYSPDDPAPGQTLTFDASGSSGAGGIQNYKWDWDGDGTVDDTTASPTIDHTFGSTAEYDVTLTVTDADGDTATADRTIVVNELRAPDDPSHPVTGINYQYYETDGEFDSMPEFGTETPTRTGTTDQIDLGPDHRENNFAFRYTGYVEVPEDGEYTLSTTSDDGSELFVGDERVVDNTGVHANRTRSGTIGLEAGKHEITVTMFEHTGQEGLGVAWDGPGVTSGTVPANALYRTDQPIAVFATDCSGPECTFDASGSSNPGGSIANYEWDLGDGTATTGATASHTYDAAGEYVINLTVVGDGGGTDSEIRTIDVDTYQPARSPGPVTQGVDYEYFETSGEYTALDDVDWAAPTRTGTTDQIDLDPSHRDDEFAFSYQTYLDVPENDTYTFSTTSDDGSVLYVDGTEVVDNRGLHAAQEASGEVALEAGYHNVTVRYFEHGGQAELSASWESTNVPVQELPASRLYRSQPTARWETVADWDAASTQSGVVHESFGDRRPDAIELGYPSGGQWGPTSIAYWPLDEDAGLTATDVVGGNDGTIQGASIRESGILGTTAYDFDASNGEYVGGATDLAALRGTATLSVWINTTQTGDDTMWQAPGITGVESAGDDDDVFWGWIDADGRISIQAGNGDAATSSTPINDGSWHHVVMTREQTNGEVQLYVDGTLVDSVESTPGEIETTFSSIGRIENSGTSFDGRIEDLVVYDQVLSGNDVTSLYDATSTGSLTTDAKVLSNSVAPGALSLQNVSATLPGETSVSVTIRSDPDGDGTFEEQSDPVNLQPGASGYDVTGLPSASDRFALELELSSSDPSVTPNVERIEIVG